MNNVINEIKNTLEGTKSRITEAEDMISEVEDRTVLWTLRERERVGRFGRMVLKHVKYHV